MIRVRVLIGVLLAGLVSAGCQPPNYVRFVSPYKDFVCDVPWGWAVYLDSSGSDFTSATFTGPLEPEFYRGTPSFSVRWYANYAPHALLGASPETYANADDFTRQMLADVYGPEAYTKAESDFDQQYQLSQGKSTPDTKRIRVSGVEAVNYIVYRTLPAPKGVNLGVVQDGQGGAVIRQRHAYVLIPVSGGFYVITYPATREGYEKYKPQFINLVKTFKLLKEGPAGPAAH
ncbi:MAG: hypothetical protein HY925_16005 [Elusimicrobia bacterium]|nr:hypothetical protein [Elusimicrobiota bacterium]